MANPIPTPEREPVHARLANVRQLLSDDVLATTDAADVYALVRTARDRLDAAAQLLEDTRTALAAEAHRLTHSAVRLTDCLRGL